MQYVVNYQWVWTAYGWQWLPVTSYVPVVTYAPVAYVPAYHRHLYVYR